MKFIVDIAYGGDRKEVDFSTLEELTEWLKTFPPKWRVFPTSSPSIILTYDEDKCEFVVTIYNNYME